MIQNDKFDVRGENRYARFFDIKREKNQFIKKL